MGNTWILGCMVENLHENWMFEIKVVDMV